MKIFFNELPVLISGFSIISTEIIQNNSVIAILFFPVPYVIELSFVTLSIDSGHVSWTFTIKRERNTMAKRATTQTEYSKSVSVIRIVFVEYLLYNIYDFACWQFIKALTSAASITAFFITG